MDKLNMFDFISKLNDCCSDVNQYVSDFDYTEYIDKFKSFEDVHDSSSYSELCSTLMELTTVLASLNRAAYLAQFKVFSVLDSISKDV